MSEKIIEVVDLGKEVKDAIGTLTILSAVSFSVKTGETVAIVGASGSGKSTLLGLIAGLDRGTHGTVRLGGEDLSSLDEDGRARLRAAKVGFVFQSFQLLPHLSALENVMLPMELQGAGSARERSQDMLAEVGLAKRFHHYPKTLSGGEQQRVALARAFVMRPPLLLADEPTGSLDAATGLGIMDLMFKLNSEYTSTLVMVTHDTDIAKRCARRLTLSAGQLIADESLAPLAHEYDATR
jgi:putative ABC transport system ATP-binding protein